MGCSAARQNVLACLAALEHVLRPEGWRGAAGAGVDAAIAHYAAAGVRTVAGGAIDESLGAGGIGRI